MIAKMDALLTAGDVAKILKVATVTIYKWAQSGVLPCYKLKSQDKRKKHVIRFKMNDIATFIEQSRVDHHSENSH